MQTSSYYGVRAERGRWRADIQIQKKKKFLGYYKDEARAAKAYDDAVTLNALVRKTNFDNSSHNNTVMAGTTTASAQLPPTPVAVVASKHQIVTAEDLIALVERCDPELAAQVEKIINEYNGAVV